MLTARLSLGLLCVVSSVPLAAQAPAIANNGILNAADYTQSVAPGSMVAVFGSNLAPKTTAATTVPLPRTLEGVTVEVMPPGGVWTAAPLYFVSPAQINIQMPFLSSATAQLRVRSAGGASAAATINLTLRAPRIFTRTMDGKGEPTLFHAKDFSWVSSAAPAVPGEFLVLLLTGLGAVSPVKEAGAPGGDNAANGPLNQVTEPVFVSFGGTEATAAFAGLMPGFPGVYQINFQVPEAAAAGSQALLVRAGAIRSQANVAAACARYASGAVVQVVPPAGGALTTSGATVTLPAGLVGEPTTMAIARQAAGATPVDAWRASDVFTITGLPEQLNAPVTLTLELTGRPASGETLLAIASGRGVRGAGLEFLEATVTGNQAAVTLPTADTDGAKALIARSVASGPEVTFYVMTFYRRVTLGDFMLFYPSSQLQEADVNAVAAVLADAKAKLEALGLSWARRTRWPLRVVIYPFTGADIDKWGMAEPSILGLNFHSISLNANKLSGGVSDELKATAGHELFHILQNLYDPRDALRIAKSPGTWLWFQEAASTWFEGIATGNRSEVPSTVRQNNYSFLTQHGLEYQPGDPAEVQSHGYGASMFLHYLTSKAGGDTVVGSILKEGLARAPGILAAPARLPVEGAAAVLPAMLSEHWRGFVRDYTEGSIYGGGFPDHREILGQLKDRHVFAEETTAGKTFTWDAPALSAAFYTVRFQAWPKDVKLTVSLTDAGGQAELSIYRIRGDNWTLVQRMRAGELDFPKPEELAANGETLLLAVANANGSGKFTGVAPIQVGVNKAVESILPLLQKTTKFGNRLYGIVKWTASDPGGPNLMGPFFGLPGLTWKGAAFTATAADSALVNAGDPPFEVTLTGTVSPDGLKILNSHLKRYRLKDKKAPDSTGKIWQTYAEETYEWDLRDLPVNVPVRGFTATTSSFRYELKGAAASAAFSGFVCKRVLYDGWADQFTPAKLKTENCSMTIPAEDRYYVYIELYR